MLGTLALPAGATDYYMTPSGAGAKTGVDWANAIAYANVNTTVNTTMQPGDTLYLEGGHNYSGGISITAGGTTTARKSIVGVDRGSGLPVLISADWGWSAIWVTGGYWTIKDLKMEHYSTAINAYSCPELWIDGVLAHFGSDLFQFNRCDNLYIHNSRADRYSHYGFFVYYDCDGVTFRNCVADGTGTGMTDDPTYWSSDKVGFKFHIKLDTHVDNTNILMEDCDALNNKHVTTDPDDYEQGDGFMAEQGNVGLTLRRCTSQRNSDGAFDLKGSNQTLEDCIALTSRNGFKLWYSGTLGNCVAVSNWAYNLQVAGPTNAGTAITADFCSFHQTSSVTVGVKTENPGNSVTLTNSIISRSGTLGSFTGGSVTLGTGTVTHSNAQITTNAPQYVSPGAWDGTGTNYDNLTYGLTKGWNSTDIGSATARIEGESVPRTGTPTPDTYTEANASAGVYANFPANAIGQNVTYTVSVPAPGTYHLVIRHRTHYNRGIGQLTIDGVNQGSPVDTYLPSPGGYSIVDYGTKTFTTPGNKAFKFTVTGKNASSSGYSLSTDYIELTPQ